MNTPTEFTAACGWCRREVINFVAPPAMVEVTIEVEYDVHRSVDRICSFCYSELLKLQSQLAAHELPA